MIGLKIIKQRLCLRSYSTASSALGHIKVLDLTRIVAGPYCTMILADMGAEVFKIENPSFGDECRHWPPNVNNEEGEMSCYFAAMNRNKKSVCVNFKSSQGKQVLLNMATKCDVLIENFIPGKLDKMGLGYNDVIKVAPDIIYCSITGYGSEGPYRERPGYDVIAASVGGMLHITGPKDGEPCKPGVATTDLATGLYAHGAILAALLNRTKTGQGQRIEVDLLASQVACLINIGGNYLNADKEGSRWGTAHESIVPYEAFQTEDGWLTVGTGSDSQFKDLVDRLGLAPLADDPRFSTNPLRVKHRQVLLPILRAHFLTKKNAEWMEVLGTGSFPCGPVNTLSQERTVTVELKKSKRDKQVKWSSETVDNEHLNKKKSKCCCIYKKPREFGESSSESENECDNCYGHVEVKKKHKKDPHKNDSSPPSLPS